MPRTRRRLRPRLPQRLRELALTRRPAGSEGLGQPLWTAGTQRPLRLLFGGEYARLPTLFNVRAAAPRTCMPSHVHVACRTCMPLPTLCNVRAAALRSRPLGASPRCPRPVLPALRCGAQVEGCGSSRIMNRCALLLTERACMCTGAVSCACVHGRLLMRMYAWAPSRVPGTCTARYELLSERDVAMDEKLRRIEYGKEGGLVHFTGKAKAWAAYSAQLERLPRSRSGIRPCGATTRLYPPHLVPPFLSLASPFPSSLAGATSSRGCTRPTSSSPTACSPPIAACAPVPTGSPACRRRSGSSC